MCFVRGFYIHWLKNFSILFYSFLADMNDGTAIIEEHKQLPKEEVCASTTMWKDGLPFLGLGWIVSTIIEAAEGRNYCLPGHSLEMAANKQIPTKVVGIYTPAEYEYVLSFRDLMKSAAPQ